MAKYDPLCEYLTHLPPTTLEITLTFQEVEKIIGQDMEPSAGKYMRSWDNTGGTSAVRQNSWLHAGWETGMVDLDNKKVRLRRKQDDLLRVIVTKRPPPFEWRDRGEVMKELVEYIVKSIVTYPDKVSISTEDSEEGLLITLDVAPEDKGRVIGKQGRVVEAMRTILRVKAAKEGTRVRLQIPQLDTTVRD